MSIEKDCNTCAYGSKPSHAEPCLNCDGESAWVRPSTAPDDDHRARTFHTLKATNPDDPPARMFHLLKATNPDDDPARTFHMLKATNPKDAIGISKAPMSTVSAAVLAEVGVAMLEGASKYGRHNYRAAGVRSSVYYDATMRHLMAWWEGEDTDPDSGMSHVTKAITSLVVLRDAMIQDMCTDDRPPRSAEFYARRNTLAAEVLARHADKSPRHYTIADSK